MHAQLVAASSFRAPSSTSPSRRGSASTCSKTWLSHSFPSSVSRAIVLARAQASGSVTRSGMPSQAKVRLARQPAMGNSDRRTPHTVDGIKAGEHAVQHDLRHGDLAVDHLAPRLEINRVGQTLFGLGARSGPSGRAVRPGFLGVSASPVTSPFAGDCFARNGRRLFLIRMKNALESPGSLM